MSGKIGQEPGQLTGPRGESGGAPGSASPSAAAPIPASPGVPPSRAAATVRVALISQSDATTKLVTTMLKGVEGVVLVAWTGHEDAVNRLLTADVSAVLLDGSPNPSTALEVLRLLRRASSTISLPVLLLCDKVAADFRAQVFALGAHDYLTYQSDAAEFVARLRYHAVRALTLKSVRKNASGLTVPAHQFIKVLMVDESKVACQIVANALSNNAEMHVTSCTVPERALAIADDLLPTVILQSLVMRDCDAFELVSSFRRNLSTRDVPIIMLSGVADPIQKAKALAGGADDYVVKSKDMEELLARVRFHSAGYYELQKGRLFTAIEGAEKSETARVLMIDDSKFCCNAIAHLLASEPQIRFAACTDPTVALAMAKEFRPTVILQDLEMPQLNGIELLQIFRDDPSTREIPIIVLSGITEAATKAKVFAEGANDFVEKQLDKIELLSRIMYHSRGYRNALRLGDSIQKLFEIQKRLEVQGEFIRKTFGRYLSDDVVNSLLASPEALKLGGEKRRITILMADLRGFTSLSERLLPEQVLAIVNNYFKVMTGILLSYGATIDEFIGDSILAVFGAPRVQEDDAQRAVACAVEMQLAMQGVNAANLREGYPEVRMGIGIHTGEVVVGNIGSEKRAKYGVVGKNVNLTSRIESYTLGGQILISQSTQQFCGDILRIDSVMEVMPKGVAQPISVYEVGGIAGRFSRFLPEKKKVELRPLSAPINVRFSVLADKHGGHRCYTASIVSLGGEAAGILARGVELERLSNLKMSLVAEDGTEVTSELYGKVTGQSEAPPDTLRVDFTFIPPEAALFFESKK